MSDYISRDAVKKALAEKCRECEDVCEEFDGIMPDCTQCLMYGAGKSIMSIPAADVREAKWIPFESRPMDEEEREYYNEHFGYELTEDEAVIYCCQLPEHGQEVLVCNKYGRIWIDTFDDDPDFGVGFEMNGDMDGLVAWMPLPNPYEPPNCGADMREDQT